jgi:hypothetical protein
MSVARVRLNARTRLGEHPAVVGFVGFVPRLDGRAAAGVGVRRLSIPCVVPLHRPPTFEIPYDGSFY